MRSCLETALYTLHMNRHAGFDELWLRRHDDADALRAVKNEFRISKTFETLGTEDQWNEAVARKLYERTTDFGAHPNERAMTSSLTIEDIEDGKRLQQAYLSGGTLQQRHALKSTAQVGLCALYIFRLVFRERFDILGVTEKLDEVRAVL